MELVRCPWVVLDDPLYVAYHDEEWGVPVHDDKKQYEFLVLEAAQAGLSWRTILHRRAAYREAFAGFDYHKVARFGVRDVARLLGNAGIIRNRAKIEAAIHNARAVLDIQEKHGSFSAYLWSFVDGTPMVNHRSRAEPSPAETLLSAQIAKELKRHGVRFIGPVTMYAHLQAAGMINDHTIDCYTRATP